MSRDGYERWEDRPEGQDPDPYDPRDPRRPRKAVRPDEPWLTDSRQQDAYNRQGSHRRSDTNADTAHGDSGYADGGYADGGYGSNGYAGGGYADNGQPGYGGRGQAGYGEDYEQGAGYGRSGYPDAGYPEPGYPDSGSSGAGHPGSSGAGTYGSSAEYGGYRDGGRGDAGYESGYRDPGAYPDKGYPANGYQSGGYGTAATSGRAQAQDPYGPPDPYTAADPYATPDPYGRPGSLGHTDPRSLTDSRGQTDPFSRTDPSRGQTDPYGRTDPSRSQTDPYGRTDSRGPADAFGSTGRYAPADAYEDDTLGRSGPPSSTYANEDSYGELGSYGRQDSHGGPAGYDTGDPFAGRDAGGRRGVSRAGYGDPAGHEYGGGYDEHDYDAAPGHDQAVAQAPDYVRHGDRDEGYSWQVPVDDTGVTRRRQRDPEDELDPDSARHNGFFRGFGATHDEVGHRPPKRRRSRAGMVALVVIVMFLGGIVGAGVYGYSWYAKRHADWTGSVGYGSVIVKVVPGEVACSQTMEDTLVRDGVVASASAFCSAAKASISASALEPGYFRLHKHMGAALAWALIINPKSRVQTTVGVPDGMRASKVIALLAAKTGIPLSQFQSALKDTSALGLPSWAKGNYEGFLWPATYPIQPGTSALGILQMMVKQANTEMASMNLAADAQRAQFTEYEVITAASLLEGEVPPQYYAKVARVIDNRLNQVPPWDLQLDSTVAYAVDKYVYNLTQSDLNVNSPYNTFKHADLPPGPIDSPDAAAIQAVLHPAHGTWLYFVTVNKKGLTLFTSSQSQFQIWSNEATQNGV